MARKVIGPTGSRRRRWLFLCTTVVALAAAAFFIAGAGAVVSGSPSHFEANDGNMVVTTNNNTDWNCFANGKSTGFANPGGAGITVGGTCPNGLNYGDASAAPADGNGEIQLVSGSKFDDLCPGLNVGNNPPKDEFQATAEYSDTNTTTLDTYFYGASIRPTTNGNSTGNLELNQMAGNGTTQHGCRSAGDRLIAFDFLNGGTTLQFHVLTYITPSNTTAGGNTGSCYSGKSVNPPCWGAQIITPDSTEFEGEVNTGLNGVTGAISAAQNGINNTAIPAFAFNEMGVNLTQVLGLQGQCVSFPQQVWETRSSGSSFTSNPQDLEFQSITINTCGSIKIIKNTDPRNINQNFGYTASGGSISPASFKLNDRNALTISSISTGTATSTITTTAANGFTTGDKVGVSISGSDSTPKVDGQYTATITGTNTFSIPLNAAVTTAGTTGSVTFNSEFYPQLTAGTYTVTEGTEPPGFSLEDLVCNDSAGNSTTVDKANAKATITVAPGGSTVCTYTNQALGEIKIVKHTDRRGIDQSFGYTSNITGNTSFSLNDAGNSAGGDSSGNTKDITNVPVGSYTVTEGAEPSGFSLESLSCSATGTGSSGGPHATGSAQADITLAAGGVVTCTYTNKATGEIKIVKHTDPRGTDQKFSYSSNLGTPSASNVSGTVACTQGGSAGVSSGNFCLNDHAGTDPSSGGSDNTLDYTNVPVGSYNVTEGAEPSGFSLENLSCSATGTGSSGAPDATTPAKANITLAAGGVVTCTYQNKATGEIKIVKHTDPRGIAQSFSYTSTITGNTSFSLNDTGNKLGGDSSGNTKDITNVLAGSYTVTEGTEPSGWTLESLSCSATGTGSSGGPHATGSAQADITVAAGGVVTCTYTNKQPTGAILITKTGKDVNCVNSSTLILNGVCTGAAEANLGGASFSITGTDLLGNTVSKTATTSNLTGTACVDGLPWNGLGNSYSVSETTPPFGYGKDPSNTDPVSVAVIQDASCSDLNIASEAALAGFNDNPLTDLTVTATAELSGATKSTVTCSTTDGTFGSPFATGGPSDPASASKTGLVPGTYYCKVVVDP